MCLHTLLQAGQHFFWATCFRIQKEQSTKEKACEVNKKQQMCHLVKEGEIWVKIVRTLMCTDVYAKFNTKWIIDPDIISDIAVHKTELF